LSATAPPSSFKAATNILNWLAAMQCLKLPIDLDLVRQMLPDTPLGRGAVIKEPADLTWGASEGALVRNPDNTSEWGIFVNPKTRAERRRFTVAHELGHFVLHRSLQSSFNCDKESVYSGIATLKKRFVRGICGWFLKVMRMVPGFSANLMVRPPWTSHLPTGQACGQPFGCMACPPLLDLEPTA